MALVIRHVISSSSAGTAELALHFSNFRPKAGGTAWPLSRRLSIGYAGW
jgi:hypothetical protein